MSDDPNDNTKITPQLMVHLDHPCYGVDVWYAMTVGEREAMWGQGYFTYELSMMPEVGRLNLDTTEMDTVKDAVWQHFNKTKGS